MQAQTPELYAGTRSVTPSQAMRTCAVQLFLSALLVGWGQFAAAQDDQGETFLEIYKQFDGSCQGLRRGDMRMLRNLHPSRPIAYRLARYVAGRRQGGLVRDTIAPGAPGEPLGCEYIDGLEQDWKVVRETFAE